MDGDVVGYLFRFGDRRCGERDGWVGCMYVLYVGMYTGERWDAAGWVR